MPTFLKRKYMRGRPELIERVLGVGALAVLAIILALLLVTGGLFGGGTAKQGFVADAKAILGVPTEPLFAVHPGNQKPASPPLEVRLAESLLPDAVDGVKALSLATESSQKPIAAPMTGETDHAASSASRPSNTSEELAHIAKNLGGGWLFAGIYLPGKSGAVRARVVDMATPERSRQLWEARKPAKSQPIAIGRGGWKSEGSDQIGFWAGRYYTEVLDDTIAPEGPDAERVMAVAIKLAGRQLVYGGENFAPETPVTANGTSQPAVATSQPAQQSPGRARFVDPGDPAITVPTKIERYTDNLYEKIDGREGQYRSFNFVELRFAQYLDTRGQQTFDTYLYDMAEPVNAMGIYMVERSPDAKLIQLGREGYASGTSAYFWKGKYYVNVLGPAEGDANAAKIALQIAQAIAESIADDGRPLWADKLLPTLDRLPDSLSYAATSALGYDFLERLFKANYKTGETTYQAFLVKADNPAKAAELFKKLAEATAKYDKVVAQQASPGGETFTGQSLDVFSVCFHKGIYLGGIIECEDRALAERKAAELRDGLPAEGGT